jgi:hypothetical protein
LYLYPYYYYYDFTVKIGCLERALARNLSKVAVLKEELASSKEKVEEISLSRCRTLSSCWALEDKIEVLEGKNHEVDLGVYFLFFIFYFLIYMSLSFTAENNALKNSRSLRSHTSANNK